MKIPVVWFPQANLELTEARAWYDNIRPVLGVRFVHALETTIEKIAGNPLQFPAVYRGLRVQVPGIPLWNHLRGAGAPDCGNRLFSRQARPNPLAGTLSLVAT